MSKKGPFGLWMGMNLEDLDCEIEEISPRHYKVHSAPAPHSAFECYCLRITPITGLSWVKAIGKTIRTNEYGLDLIAAFKTMEEKLSRNYGKGDRTDVLLPDSIWDEPKDWMQSIAKKQRYFYTIWSRKHGSTLPEDLESVGLMINAIDFEDGYISLEYTFSNSDAAEKEESDAEDDAL